MCAGATNCFIHWEKKNEVEIICKTDCKILLLLLLFGGFVFFLLVTLVKIVYNCYTTSLCLALAWVCMRFHSLTKTGHVGKEEGLGSAVVVANGSQLVGNAVIGVLP